jgi:uncharacterized membrane protein YwaF
MYLSTPLATRQATILKSVTVHIILYKASQRDVLLQSVMMMVVVVVVVMMMMMMMMKKRSAQPWPLCSAEVNSSRFTFVTKTPCLLQVFHSIHSSSEETHNRLCKQHVLNHFITRS